ncbi:hypothetical protein [Halosimplex salinum]|uniref:hypothetical protein n=1 Tax=Halosimplex salinum TaxID=1710538 RepID=UPI0013DE148E|nr:hypothetical protein [Halosimplex salinum]
MIESSPCTANISTIDLSQEDYERLIEGIENTPYTDERSFGFIPETVEPNRLSANLVFRTATTIRDINESTQEIEDVQQKKTDLIPFSIDYDRTLLSVFSNKEDTKKLVTRLSGLADWGISINSLSLDLSSVYKEISTREYSAQITGLRISDFAINEYTNGSYHLNVFEEHEGQRLLREYTNDVSYVTVEYEMNHGTVSVGFYDSGSVRIYSKSTEDDELFSHVKDVIATVGGNQ